MYDISIAILDLDPDLCQFFSFLRNFVNSAHTDMYDASNESWVQGLHFFFLHLRAVSNIWERYDPKTEKSRHFACNDVVSWHIIKCNTSIESFYEGLHFFTNELWGIYEGVMIKKNMKIWWFNYALCSLIHLICSKRLVFETTS